MSTSGATVVSKTKHVWRDGDVAYRATFAGGDGTGLVTVDVETKSAWESLVELGQPYDIDVNCETNGYKHYLKLLNASEV